MTGSLSENGIVIGIYGISGVGKSYLLNQISTERIEWRVVDGSQLIREVLKERNQTMEDFERMTLADKGSVRKSAIETAKKKPGVTLVAGHCSFARNDCSGSDGESVTFNDVFTQSDGDVYDAIFYLEKPSLTVLEQVKSDKERKRPIFSVNDLDAWVHHEKEMLGNKCLEHGIIFQVLHLDGSNDYCDLISLIVYKIILPASRQVKMKSEQALVSSIKTSIPAADVYLLIDGDHTLCPQDTGTLFFDQVSTLNLSHPLKKIFKRYEDYTFFQAFWEVSMLYNKVMTTDQYTSICQQIGREQVCVYDAWKILLDGLPINVHPIIVSSSIREVWLAMQTKHIEDHGKSLGLGRASIIAGNNLSMHSYIVDTHAKALVARTLRKLHGGCHILSFGDSGETVAILLLPYINVNI